jgi:hypothetical protein
MKKLEELQQRRASGTRKEFYTVKSGPNNIRVMPNWKGEPDGDFFRETAYHKNLGPDRDKQVVCLIREGGDFCPICDFIKKLYSTKNKEDAELAKSIRAQQRVIFNIVNLDDTSKGVQIWMTGTDILEQILGFDANPKYEDVTDPENGRNLVVNFTEAKQSKTGWNDYKVQPDPDRTPVSDPELLLQMNDLDAIVKPTTVENMLELLGVEPDTKPLDKAAPPPTTFAPAPQPQTPATSAQPAQQPAKSSNIQELMARLRAERGSK